VILVRRHDEPDSWALPGTFLHPGERLAEAVLRSLDQKVGLRGTSPRQLHVFDDPKRDDRGWVLSVAHVVVLPWQAVAPVVEARSDDVRVGLVGELPELTFWAGTTTPLPSAASSTRTTAGLPAVTVKVPESVEVWEARLA